MQNVSGKERQGFWKRFNGGIKVPHTLVIIFSIIIFYFIIQFHIRIAFMKLNFIYFLKYFYIKEKTLSHLNKTCYYMSSRWNKGGLENDSRFNGKR